MEKICETCVKRHGDVCEGSCPDEVKQREFNVGTPVYPPKVDWPTVPLVNEKLPAFKKFWLRLSPQQRILLSFLLAGFDRKEIVQHANITPKTFDVQANRIKAQSKFLLTSTPKIRTTEERGSHDMKTSDGPLKRIELKVRVWPVPVFDEQITFHVDTKEDQDVVLDLYNTIIQPMVQNHLMQLTKELQGMVVCFDLMNQAQKQGLDPEEVFSNEELRRKIWENEENEEDGNQNPGL
jgi:hypothetical protein